MNACLEHLQDECIVEGACSVRGQRLHAVGREMEFDERAARIELKLESSNDETQGDIGAVALADGLHVGRQGPLLCKQRELRLRINTGQRDDAAAVDNSHGADGEGAGALELENEVPRLPVLQRCQAHTRQSTHVRRRCNWLACRPATAKVVVWGSAPLVCNVALASTSCTSMTG